ncbi:hypothetical protein JQ615_05700 [Bradyrhizobium jicamae]|uniref:Transposase n=1 Tax=Bradyrhizobium jicamae TaxID=280332 RepID=A0ABS5FDL4_9BRAD|nr:hypothetical protein [Bradyrhizobium jicamae]MBR0794883.1 hypothetical protein [Bradyrhizobium jicamae]
MKSSISLLSPVDWLSKVAGMAEIRAPDHIDDQGVRSRKAPGSDASKALDLDAPHFIDP